MRNPYIKIQDDISNMNTYVRTYVRTDKPKPICPLRFQSWGHNEKNVGGGGRGGGAIFEPKTLSLYLKKEKEKKKVKKKKKKV